MAKLFFRFGRLIVISRTQKQIRGTVVFLLRNFFLAVGILLTLEVILITMSLSGIVLPLPTKVMEVLSSLVL